MGILYYFIEALSESFGILREVWFKKINIQDDPILKYHPIFRQAADTLSVLDAFDIASDVSTPYGQRLSTFIQVRYAGMYCQRKRRTVHAATIPTGIVAGF